MQYLIMILINLLVIFVVSVHSASNISLCHDVPSNLSTSSLPEVVLLREHNSNDIRMTSALDDVDCWINKYFKVVDANKINTKGDNETICYSIATVNIKVKQLMIVISEGQSAQNCTPSIYGPIPNILNIKMFIDTGSKNDSVRRMELSFRNPGGHLGVQFEFHRRSVVSKIQKTLEFMLQLNNQTFKYSHLIPFWNPTIHLPPVSWQYRKLVEEKKRMEAKNMSISWVLLVSVMPMIFFGIIVSCYIVIQPRGGLTYTDEEVDFTIQEVDSASRVNMVQPKIHTFKTAPIVYADPTPPPPEGNVDTAMEPTMRRDAPTVAGGMRTAIPLDSDDVHTDKTVLSELKSTKTVRLPVATTKSTDASAETLSLRTGRD